MLKNKVEDGLLRFSRRHHHVNKQPILVIFSDNNKGKQSSQGNNRIGKLNLCFWTDLCQSI